ncbi:MAG TPA: NADH-quinone oxidoreductase subunit L [Armatimonadota bacterium]
MLSLLWLVPALPLLGFLVLTLVGFRLPRLGVAVIGVGSVALSCILAILAAASLLMAPPASHSYTQILWTWLRVGSFAPEIALTLDPLSLVMIVVVTFVAALIHLYSVEFMAGDESFRRFFAYMNLFVASMLVLVLADNLLLLYLGWEGVGLCSYLLIGFWYKDPVNVAAANKAFIVTRVGDTAMAVGIFLLFTQLGTLRIAPLMGRAAEQWPVGSGMAVAAAALLLGGAVGKSAQLPLQTWLPDAMAGPTPVSALIHAATMVTAGVYLIARTNVLFTLAPAVQLVVAVVGAATLLLAGCSALVQRDIKRVLAYSTISQIGYMFLALGVGAWSAAIFHFMTHAFFKALLFLGAGVVIEALHDEHDIYKMGGLRRQLPLTFWTFLIGSASLAALPLVTAGFYSKDLILWQAWSSSIGSAWLWAAGVLGSFLTAVYTFRVVFLTFFGDAKLQVSKKPGMAIRIPLVVLAVLSVVGGFVETPRFLGHASLFTELMRTTLPAASEAVGRAGDELTFDIIAASVMLVGIYLAYLVFLGSPRRFEDVARAPSVAALRRFWFAGWGFDWLYDRVLVQPYVWIAHRDRNDVIDQSYRGIAWLAAASWRTLSRTQTGRVRWYAAGIAAGAIIILAIVVFRT